MTRVTFLLAVVLAAGCGGTKHAASTSTAAPATTHAARPPATTSTGPGALQGEAAQAAAGDIPDNQVFVTYSGAQFSIKFPEGWARTGGAGETTFRDKNNIVRAVVQSAPAPTVASVRAELAQLAGAKVKQQPAAMKIGGKPAVHAVYTTTSAPNAVTGRRVTLVVDRYELGNGKLRATVDLGTPVGVDNVDAYRMMIQSFRLR